MAKQQGHWDLILTCTPKPSAPISWNDRHPVVQARNLGVLLDSTLSSNNQSIGPSFKIYPKSNHLHSMQCPWSKLLSLHVFPKQWSPLLSLPIQFFRFQVYTIWERIAILLKKWYTCAHTHTQKERKKRERHEASPPTPHQPLNFVIWYIMFGAMAAIDVAGIWQPCT